MLVLTPCQCKNLDFLTRVSKVTGCVDLTDMNVGNLGILVI